MTKTTKRSALAIGGGLLVTIILSIGMDAILHFTQVFPPMGQAIPEGLLVVATIYRTAFSVFGAYLTGRWAPERPVWHGVVLGCIGILLGTLGLLATRGKGPAYGPPWYPLALVLLALPQSWLGAWIFKKQLESKGGHR